MNMLEHARSLGFPVEMSERMHLDESASRLLRSDSFAVPVDVRAGILEVLVDHVPTPAQFEALERASGNRVTVVVTTPELLARTRQRVQALASATTGRSIRSLWQAARDTGALGVTAVTGQPPSLVTVAGPQHLDSQPAVLADEILQWSQDVLAGREAACVPDGDDIWRVTLSDAAPSPMLAMRRLPSTLLRADELGLPASAVSLASADSGLVLVAGPPTSGRSSVAIALAERALAHVSRPAALITTLVERPLPSRLSSTWAVLVDEQGSTADSAVTSARSAGASVLLLDCPRSPGMLAAAAQAAQAGCLVFAVVDARDVTAAVLELSSVTGAHTASQVLVGSISCRLLPDSLARPVSVFEVALVTGPVRAAIADNPSALTVALEASGLAGGTTLELALATANAVGRLPAETARAAARDLPRFDAATGLLGSLYVSDSTDVDAPLLSADERHPGPRKRSRSRR